MVSRSVKLRETLSLLLGQSKPGNCSRIALCTPNWKTVCISFLNIELHDEPAYHNVYKVQNAGKSRDELLDEREIHFVELGKYDETLADSLNTSLDRWVHFLKLAGDDGTKRPRRELSGRARMGACGCHLNTPC